MALGSLISLLSARPSRTNAEERTPLSPDRSAPARRELQRRIARPARGGWSVAQQFSRRPSSIHGASVAPRALGPAYEGMRGAFGPTSGDPLRPRRAQILRPPS